MDFIENGKTYTLENAMTGKMLNLYGGNTTNGTIVVQDAFYLDPDFTTIRNSNGITFTNVPE